jgi:hypothetical protein
MKISPVEPLILHMPLNRDSIADSSHSITHWGRVGVRLRTAARPPLVRASGSRRARVHPVD